METRPVFLIAEDDPDDQFLFQDAIDVACLQDVETYFVWDGGELMDFLQEMAKNTRRPVLIVLDLNMPGKDGRRALQEIKADPDLESIPVVILTTSYNDADARYCRDHGAAGYYIKPGSIAELEEIIRSLCTDYLN